MGKGKSISIGNGGMGGSGIFGHLGLGTVIKCESTDTSYYCTFMKFMNILGMLIILAGIVYFAYNFFIKPMLSGRRSGGKKSS